MDEKKKLDLTKLTLHEIAALDRREVLKVKTRIRAGVLGGTGRPIGEG
jgi:hypothetical protein